MCKVQCKCLLTTTLENRYSTLCSKIHIAILSTIKLQQCTVKFLKNTHNINPVHANYILDKYSFITIYSNCNAEKHNCLQC